MTAATPVRKLPAHASRWDALVWPRWLPVQARLPLIAQITGAVALTALLTAPWWSSIPEPRPEPHTPAGAPPDLAFSAAVRVGAPTKAAPAEAPARPAHLNLEVRHSFASVDFSVSVDGKPALQTRLPGSGKRFKVFGKRSERGYTRTIDLPPGARIVRVRVVSAPDKFDQTRVERFDLGSASVATLRVSADKSGLALLAERPSVRPAERPQAPQAAVAPPAAVPIAAATVPAAATAPRSSQEANAVVDLLQSVRSILIAIAGFVASAATGFVVQEYLRSRRGLIFAAAEAQAELAHPQERRRRRRPGKARRDAQDNSVIGAGGEPTPLSPE